MPTSAFRCFSVFAATFVFFVALRNAEVVVPYNRNAEVVVPYNKTG